MTRSSPLPQPNPLLRANGIRPRGESIPRDPQDLTEDQKRAANRAVSLIDAIARLRTPTTGPGQQKGIAQVLPWLDELRFNHNVLIDGGRGTGKTSVMLTILKYWTERAFHQVGRRWNEEFVQQFETMVLPATDSGEESAGSAATGQSAGQDKETVDTREPIILPVPIIDLQPLASTTDLRLFLANSLHKVMEATSAPASPQPRWGPDASRWPPDETTDVREAWEKFRDAAALGSDHVHARRARLDAATYAVELELAESHRQVAQTFGEFITALRESAMRSELTRWGEYRPLFVVPIDDADMNPRLGAQLIETVNLLSHDDLAYLITGDTELFLLLLREHLAGGFRHSLRSVDLESDDTTDIDDLIHLRSLAHQVYDKHIPHAHRCRIDPLPGSRRVQLLADSLSEVRGEFEQLPIGPDPDSPAASPVSNAAASADGTTTSRTLAYYFDLGGEGNWRTEATDGFTDPALPETMRGLDDAREMIEWRIRARGNAGMSTVAEVVRYFWRDRINSSLLRGTDRRDLLNVVRLEESDVRSDGTGRLGLSTEKFAVQSTLLHREIISRPLLSGDFGREHRWALREILDYEFRLNSEARSATPGGSAEFLLPSGVGGALILATDVAADLPTGTFIGKPLSPAEFNTPFVVTSVFNRKEGEYFDFPWPMPDWDSFRDFHIFSRAWGRVVSKLSRASDGAGRLLDHLVYPYIALVASVWFDRHGNGEESSRSDFRRMVDEWVPMTSETGYALGRRQLDPLTRAINRELKGTHTHRRDQDFRHWYNNRLLLLAAPESGLSVRVANLVYEVLMGARFANYRRHIRPPQRRSEFDQTAIGARVARANQARIGGGKETGVPIRAVYPVSIETHVDNLLIQIDDSLTDSTEEYHYPRHDPAAREAVPPARAVRRRKDSPSSLAEPAE